MEFFRNTTDEELKRLYEDFLKGKKEGLRPQLFDPYIYQVQEWSSMTFGEAWSVTERLFLEEVARRYFGTFS